MFESWHYYIHISYKQALISLIPGPFVISIVLPVVLFDDVSGEAARICGVLTRTGEAALGDNDKLSAVDTSDLMWTGDSVRKKWCCSVKYTHV